MQGFPGGNLTFRNEACNPICCGPCTDLHVMLAIGIVESGSKQDLKGEERTESKEPEGVFTEAECEPGVCGRDNQTTALRRQGCQGYQ